MAQQTPLYQGTQFAPAKIAGAASPTQHPFAQQFNAAAQGATQTALGLEQAIIDRQEYTLEQKRSAALQEAAHSMNMEFMDRLQRADGTEGSLFDEFGQLNQEAVNDLKQKYLSISDAWTTGFTTERGMRAAAEAQNKYRASVVESIDSKILASLKPRALQALQNNMDLAIMRGEYDYADAYATDALSRGMLSKAEVNAIHYKNNRLRQINIIDNIDDAETLSNYYHDPANQDFLQENPAIADRLLRKMEALLTYKGTPESMLSDGSDEKLVTTTATAEQSTTETTAGSTSGTSKPKIKRAEPPPAADGFTKLHFLMHGDDLKSPEAQKNAHALFLKYVGTIADTTTSPDGATTISEQARFEAELLAKTLQLPESTVNRILNQRQEALQATLSKFNPASARTSLYATFKASQDVASGTLPKDGEHTDYWKGVFASHARDIENALRLAENDFYKWYANNPQANDVQQARAYQQFVHNRRSQELIDYPAHGWNHMRIGEYFTRFEASANRAGINRVLDERQRKIYEQQLKAETDHYNKVKDNAEMLRDYYRGDLAGAAIRRQVNMALDHQFSNFRFTVNTDNPAKASSLPDSNSELILYVNPQETGSFSEQRSFLIPYNGNVYNVKIVATDAVDTAVPSIKMQQTFKLLGKKYNRLDFNNNTLNSIYFKPSKKSKQDYIYTPDTKGHYRATSGPDDGLVPPEDTGELDLSSVELQYDDATGEPSLFPADNESI